VAKFRTILCTNKFLNTCNLQHCTVLLLRYWCHRVDAKGSDASFPSAVVVDAGKVKTIVFQLVGTRKGIRPVNLHTKILLRKIKGATS